MRAIANEIFITVLAGLALGLIIAGFAIGFTFLIDRWW